MITASVPFILFIFGTVSVAVVLNRRTRAKSHQLPLPPGPKGLPLVGNVNDLPKAGELEWHHWLRHKDTYGTISSITVLGQTFIILNDAKIAVELLTNRAAIYSARPYMHFSSEMIGWKNSLAFSGYTETFKQHRKNIAKVAGSNTSHILFNRVQEEEAAHFLVNVLGSPDKLFDHIKKEAAAVILKVTYGYTVAPHGEDPLVELVGKTMHEFADATVPGKWAVDILPVLDYLPEWFPGATFKKIARERAANLRRTCEQPYQFVKRQMREKSHKTSFLSQAIETCDPNMENLHKWSALSMYTGGADTTVSSLMTFFLAMMLFPDVQKKAQEEIDRVLGSRLPVNSDIKNLPYIEAVVKETHRWHPVAPMAIPHLTTEEDEVNGYRIPKGSLVIPNNWWFTHDPAVYPQPMEFKPERFLGSTPEPDPRTWTFGYGRRVCPGRYIADLALFITIAQSLSVFDIAKPIENGRVIEPEVKFEAGVVSHPLPYRADIRPRSEKHKQMIQEVGQRFPLDKSDKDELTST